MAKNATATQNAPASAPAEPAPAPAKKRRRTVLIAALGAALIAGGALGAAWKFTSSSDEEAEAEGKKGAGKKAAGKKGETKAAAKPARPPQYVPLEVMTVNLRDDGSAEHYLQVGLTFQVAGAEVEPVMKQYLPIIRSSILLLLSSKTAGELASVQGKTRLAEELLAAAREPMPETGSPDKGIVALHYSTFIVQ